MNPLPIIFLFVFGVVVGGFATFKIFSWLVTRMRVLGFHTCDRTDDHMHVFVNTPWSTTVSELPFGADPEFVKLHRERERAVASTRSFKTEPCDGKNVRP